METQIKFLQARLDSYNYDQYGNPIGVEIEEYNAIVEQLETLENTI